MRCCANCFWGFTEDDENNLEGYDEYDLNKPKAGDCCIGQEHDENYCCKEHQYIDGMEEYENIILYDEEYLGKGYLIVSKLDNKIIKFLKICKFEENEFPQYFIRAYEKDRVDNPNEEFRDIIISTLDDDPLYDVIRNFTININREKINTIDVFNQGKNYMEADYSLFDASLTLYKDVYGVKHATDFIDITIGDNYTCNYYQAITTFYNDLSKISKGKTKEEDIKKLLKI